MCGRFTLAVPEGALVEHFEVPPLAFALRPRFNVAPGQDALVVGEDRKGRRMGLLRWGLVPSWSDRPGTGFINARGETVGETPSFRDAFVSRRCLIPADGFYEWQAGETGKTPFLFRPAEGGILALAAIWEHWEAPGHEPRDAFAIVTVQASEDVSGIHDRMPVVIPPSGYAAWLGHDTPLADVYPLIRPLGPGRLRAHPVSTRVNNVSQDDPGLVEPAG